MNKSTSQYKKLYKYIYKVSDILGLNINPPDSEYIFKDYTKYYENDIWIETFHQQVLNKNNILVFQKYLERPSGIYELQNYDINSEQDIHNIYTKFIKDSYYDSPINFLNLKKYDETESEFKKVYNNNQTYFYMGKYFQQSTSSFLRIYVRHNKDQVCNEYISKEINK